MTKQTLTNIEDHAFGGLQLKEIGILLDLTSDEVISKEANKAFHLGKALLTKKLMLGLVEASLDTESKGYTTIALKLIGMLNSAYVDPDLVSPETRQPTYVTIELETRTREELICN